MKDLMVLAGTILGAFFIAAVLPTKKAEAKNDSASGRMSYYREAARRETLHPMY